MPLILGGRLDSDQFDKCLILWTKHQPENRSVGGSIPPLGTMTHSIVLNFLLLSSVDTRARLEWDNFVPG
jgi:hypothetical protein